MDSQEINELRDLVNGLYIYTGDYDLGFSEGKHYIGDFLYTNLSEDHIILAVKKELEQWESTDNQAKDDGFIFALEKALANIQTQSRKGLYDLLDRQGRVIRLEFCGAADAHREVLRILDDPSLKDIPNYFSETVQELKEIAEEDAKSSNWDLRRNKRSRHYFEGAIVFYSQTLDFV